MASARSFRRARLHAPRLPAAKATPPAASLYALLAPRPAEPAPVLRPTRLQRRRVKPARGVAVAGLAAASALLGPTLAAGPAAAAVPTGKGVVLNAPIVGVASMPGGGGYWEVAADGGIFAFGKARFHGSTGSVHLNQPIVGMAPTPDGRGYWEVARDGGVFAFGDAGFHGSAAGQVQGDPVVGLAATPDGQGYWEATSTGAVYAFGDARYAGGAPAGSTVVAITAGTSGYRLATSAGGIDDFGGAPFLGSAARVPIAGSLIGMSSATTGYVAVGSDGGIFSFGALGYYGSLGGSTVASRASSAPADGITAVQQAAWSRVNLCEEGGDWSVNGPVYSGGLGFSHANWDRFNTFGFPADAADATPDEQIRVAVAFATQYWGNPDAAPDQHGCSGGY